MTVRERENAEPQRHQEKPDEQADPGPARPPAAVEVAHSDQPLEAEGEEPAEPHPEQPRRAPRQQHRPFGGQKRCGRREATDDEEDEEADQQAGAHGANRR
jgi:hypothetical protein